MPLSSTLEKLVHAGDPKDTAAECDPVDRETRNSAGRTPFVQAIHNGWVTFARSCTGDDTLQKDDADQQRALVEALAPRTHEQRFSLAYLQDELGVDLVGLLGPSILEGPAHVFLLDDQPSTRPEHELLSDIAIACQNGQEKLALRLLKALGAGLHVMVPVLERECALPDCRYMSPLGLALHHGHYDFARTLLRLGADPMQGAIADWTPVNTVTPLLSLFCMTAAGLGAVRFLLSETAVDVDRRCRVLGRADNDGVTALQLAYEQNTHNVEAVRLLLAAGADPRPVRLEHTFGHSVLNDPVTFETMRQLFKDAKHQPKRLRILHKARACHDAAAAVAKVVEDARKTGEVSREMEAGAAAIQLRERCAATAPAFVRPRLLRGEAAPRAELASAAALEEQGVRNAERLRAVVDFVVFGGLCPEHFVELKEMLALKWYDPMATAEEGGGGQHYP